MTVNTIIKIPHDKCTGCGACYNKCPHEAITMQYDGEGFLYPHINDICVSCGLCLEVCPETQQEKIHTQNIVPECYAMWGADKLRKVSSSGGMFGVLAEYVLDKGGYVCGAAFADNYRKVEHIIVNDVDGIAKLRGSKYVLSDTKLTYKTVERLLKEGSNVLYTGVSCQIAGLKAYLQTDYDRLICVDILCHGGPSLTAYQEYIDELAQGRKLAKFDFREKSYWGWGTASSIYFEDGSDYHGDCYHDNYWVSFLSGLSTRLCCATCHYANTNRVGDFSLGDFWGVEQIDSNLNDGKGTSLVLVNSKKAQAVLEKVKEKCVILKKVDFNRVKQVAKTRNGQLLWPQKRHWARERFFKLLKYKSFSEAFIYATESKYDVGVTGWWYNENYGGALTYYALHQVLKKMGQSVLMIAKCSDDPNYIPAYTSVPYRFAQKNYSISKNYSHATIGQLSEHCKTFISGSDQLFNPTLWTYSGPQYFLNYVSMDKNIVSYASSFGQNFHDVKNLRFAMSYWLHRFNAISVRESYAVDICKDVFGIDAPHVVDPVFLCDVVEYEKQAAKSKAVKNAPYLLSYYLDPNPQKRESILHLSGKLGYGFVNLVAAEKSSECKRRLGLPNTMDNADIEDWLYYYKNSDFVITDSFHGTAFALIFRKPFIAVANKQRGEKRFVSLLNDFGLLDHLIYDFSEIDQRPALFEAIDYDAVYKKVEGLIHFSYQWLENAVKKPAPRTVNDFTTINFAIETLRKEQDRRYEQLRASIVPEGTNVAQQSEIERLANNTVLLQDQIQKLNQVVFEQKSRLLLLEASLLNAGVKVGLKKQKKLSFADLRKVIEGGTECIKQHGWGYTLKLSWKKISNQKR